MQYTEGEIVREYQQARYKNKQIGILAQLNTCQRKDIIEILERNGVEIPDKYKASREEEYNYGTMVAKEKKPYRMQSTPANRQKKTVKPEETSRADELPFPDGEEPEITYVTPEDPLPEEEVTLLVDNQPIYKIQKSELPHEYPKHRNVSKDKSDGLYYTTWLRMELLDRKMTKLERKYKRLKKLYKQLANFILG